MLASGSPNNAAVSLEGSVSADSSALPVGTANSDGGGAVARPSSGTSSSLELTHIPSSSIAIRPSGALQTLGGVQPNRSNDSGSLFDSRVESVRDIVCQVDPKNPLGWMTFTLSGMPVVALKVPESFRPQAIECKDRVMSHLQSGAVDHTSVSLLTAPLEAIPGIQFRYPQYQPGGDLFVSLCDELPWSLRPQLFSGCVLGHEGLGAAKLLHSEYLALRLCGGEAVYFVARGRDAHEIVAVQVQSDAARKYKLTAFTGLGGVVASHTSEDTSSVSDLALVGDLLTKVSDGRGHEATIPLSTVISGDWLVNGRYDEAIAYAGRFLTTWKALQEECSPNVLDTPAMVAQNDVLRQSRGRVSVLLTNIREDLPNAARIAVITDAYGVDEILYSSGDQNLIGRLFWKQLWVRAIDAASNPLQKPEHLRVMLRRILSPEVQARDALVRPELDPPSAGIFNVLREKAIHLFNRISRRQSVPSDGFDPTLAA
jgi:hypothetical protein